MGTQTIYVVTKGGERVSLADKKSALDLINALAALDCTEPFAMTSINGNKQDLATFETGFLDKHVNVITLQDAEKVLHWMMAFGCNKVSIEKLVKEEETNGRNQRDND